MTTPTAIDFLKSLTLNTDQLLLVIKTCIAESNDPVFIDGVARMLQELNLKVSEVSDVVEEEDEEEDVCSVCEECDCECFECEHCEEKTAGESFSPEGEDMLLCEFCMEHFDDGGAEWFDRKYPNCSCFRCEKKLNAKTVRNCGGGGDCETWYCEDCWNAGTHDCAVCMEMNK